MDTRGSQTNEPVQFSFEQTLTVSAGTVVVVVVAVLALSYPAVAVGATLGVLAMVVNRHLRRWFGGLSARLGRYTASRAGETVSDDDRAYNTTTR